MFSPQGIQVGPGFQRDKFPVIKPGTLEIPVIQRETEPADKVLLRS